MARAVEVFEQKASRSRRLEDERRSRRNAWQPKSGTMKELADGFEAEVLGRAQRFGGSPQLSRTPDEQRGE